MKLLQKVGDLKPQTLLIWVIGILLILGSVAVFASGDCKGRNNCNKGEAGGNEQTQAQIGINANLNRNTAEATSRSNSDARAASDSRSNSVANGGQSRSGAAATGGSANSTGGGAVDNSETVVSVSETNSVVTEYDNDYAASSAAAVYGGYCQTGASGQTSEGGFSVANGDQFCEHVRMADRALKAYVQCNEIEETCTDEQEAEYLVVYHDNLADANRLIQGTVQTGFIGRAFNQLIPVFAVIGGLIFLL